MSKYLISGICGFVGTNLAEHLMDAGHRVIGVDNLSNCSKENIDWILENANKERMDLFIEGDLCDKAVCDYACQGVDYVLHQAALGSVPRSVKDPRTTVKNNVMSTINLLVAARDAGVKRFVYASSASVYGNVEGEILKEDMPTNPFNPYAASKLAGEDLVRVFWKVYGFETVALRYFNVFGPRQNPEGEYAAVVPRFVKMALSGKQATIYGDGEQVRDFTHVDNVVHANILACKGLPDDVCGEASNISAGKLITVNELHSRIVGATDCYVEPEYKPKRDGDVMGCKADIKHAFHFLGYEPKIDVGEGIHRAVSWYEKQRQDA